MKTKTFLSLAVSTGLIFILANVSFAVEKIGFISIQEIIATSDAGKTLADGFRKVMEKDRASLQEKENQLKKMKEELEKQRTTLKEDIIKQKEATFDKQYREFQVMANDFNTDLRQREQEIFRQLIPEIAKVLKTMGEREKYTMIVDPGMSQIPYFTTSQDITKQVVQEFNKAYKLK